MSAALDSAIAIAFAAVLALLGTWGMRNVAVLLPPDLPEHDRDRRRRVLVRGAVTCQCVAAVFVVGAVLRVAL